jgi:poly-beta-1,6-N-acetyl-D-glucosamine synthase
VTVLEVCFWLSAACVAYAYVGYPLLLAVAARLWPRCPLQGAQVPRSVSVVVAAHNEEISLGRRLAELTGLVAASGLEGEVILVSDGSTDGTATVARGFDKHLVRVLELPERAGKAAALTLACAEAKNEILVFADVRQSWAPDALQKLLENFADPTVGAVSGDLRIDGAQGVMAGIGLYWKVEKWLRVKESQIASTVGVTGAISAVRRTLFCPIPAGTLLDDVYWPLRVAMQGYRVVHDTRAHAFDRLPPKTADEFRRKVRTLSGNFQLLARLPAALLPWCNPVWFQLVSHKLLRLLVPWTLLAVLILSAVLPGWLYTGAFLMQLGCYAVGLAGTFRAVGSRFRLASAAASFLVLNSAAWVAFWVWASGKATRSWHKVSYQCPRPARPVPSISPGCSPS